MIEALAVKGFTAIVHAIVEDAVNTFTGLMAAVSGMALEILDYPMVENGILYAQGLALSILGVKYVFEIWHNHMLYQNGDSDARPTKVLINLVKSIALIGSMPWIVRQTYVWGAAVASDISKIPGASDSGSLVDLFSQSQSSGAIISLMILTALILLVIVTLQSFVRAAELAELAATGSFMALGETNNSSSYSTWWKRLLAVSLTNAVQIYMLKVSFFSLEAGLFSDVSANVALFIACLYVAYKIPSRMQQMAASTGVSTAIGGAAKQVGHMIMMRKLMMRG